MAPTVLALHGITSNGRAWDAVARELGGDVRLLAPDLRGRGDAGRSPGPTGWPATSRTPSTCWTPRAWTARWWPGTRWART